MPQCNIRQKPLQKSMAPLFSRSPGPGPVWTLRLCSHCKQSGPRAVCFIPIMWFISVLFMTVYTTHIRWNLLFSVLIWTTSICGPESNWDEIFFALEPQYEQFTIQASLWLSPICALGVRAGWYLLLSSPIFILWLLYLCDIDFSFVSVVRLHHILL